MKKIKKSQLKLGESIAVLIIFIILFVFGLFFYSRARMSSLSRQDLKYYEQQLMIVSQRMTYLPEIQCTSFNHIEMLCIDKYKLKSFSDSLLEDDIKEYYSSIIPSTEINITKIYPVQQNPESYIISTTPLQPTGFETVFIPITLLDPINNHYSMAMMRVRFSS